jgi:O-acetylserine/cysteine efflux transporter
MKLSHIALAIILAAIWGFNFIFIQVALQQMSPLMLCVMRFFLSSIPVIFVIKRPQISWKLLISYSLLIFALQFFLLFAGIAAGVTPGLAGLLAQTQVFFSFFFAALFLKEHLKPWQLLGALLACAGIGVVLGHTGGDVSVLGFFLVLSASMSWGAGNLLSKKMGPVDVMALVVWASFISFIPLFFLCCFMEGSAQMLATLEGLSWKEMLALSYIAYGSTWLGYGIWNWLLARHPIATVVPFTFLVPIFAMFGSILVFGETLQSWKIAAAVFILLGLAMHMFGGRLLGFWQSFKGINT